MKRIYFSGTEPWWPADFRVGGIGIREVMSPQRIDRPSGLPMWLLVAFEDAVEILLEEKVRLLPAGHAVLWPPGRRQFFGKKTGRWSHTWIYGSGASWDHSLAGIPLEQPIPIQDSLFQRLLEAAYHEIIERDAPHPVILRALLEALAAHLRRMAPLPARQARAQAALARARDLMQRRLHQPLDLTTLARAAGLSVSQFSAAYHRAFGTSPIRHLRAQRLQRAARLLENHALTIKEVATQVGYPDPLHFSREFHKATGLTPTAHRQQSSADPT